MVFYFTHPLPPVPHHYSLPVRDQLVELLNQPLHVLPHLLHIIADGVEVILLSLKILQGRGSLEHPSQAGIDAVHPLNHCGELLLVHPPLLRDLLELNKIDGILSHNEI